MENPFWAVMPKKHMLDLLTDDQRLRVREEFVEPNCDGPQGWVFLAGLCQCCMSHVVRGTYMDHDPTAALDSRVRTKFLHRVAWQIQCGKMVDSENLAVDSDAKA